MQVLALISLLFSVSFALPLSNIQTNEIISTASALTGLSESIAKEESLLLETGDRDNI